MYAQTTQTPGAIIMINNPQLFMEGFWNWSILEGCFGGSTIMPSDIDGIVEKNGYLLCIETKKPGVKVGMGQDFVHKALVNSGHSVLIVWGNRDKPVRMKLITPHVTKEYENADLATLRMVVAKWFAFASSKKRRGKVTDAGH